MSQEKGAETLQRTRECPSSTPTPAWLERDRRKAFRYPQHFHVAAPLKSQRREGDLPVGRTEVKPENPILAGCSGKQRARQSARFSVGGTPVYDGEQESAGRLPSRPDTCARIGGRKSLRYSTTQGEPPAADAHAVQRWPVDLSSGTPATQSLAEPSGKCPARARRPRQSLKEPAAEGWQLTTYRSRFSPRGI